MNTDTKTSVESTNPLVNFASAVDPVAEVETESDTASLPDCISVAEVTSPVSLNVELYGEGCLDCTVLRSDLGGRNGVPADELPKCHFSRNNTGCPAEYVQLVFVGQRKNTLNRILKAKEARDGIRVASLLAKAEKELTPDDLNWLMESLGLL